MILRSTLTFYNQLISNCFEGFCTGKLYTSQYFFLINSNSCDFIDHMTIRQKQYVFKIEETLVKWKVFNKMEYFYKMISYHLFCKYIRSIVHN